MDDALHPTDNLFDFFHDRVQVAQRDARLDLEGDTTLYLAQLLTERARTDRPAPAVDTLAELHAAAAHAPPGRQASTYRELGDRALYLLGFFREHLDRARRPVGPAYYADMGAIAYHRCDQVFKRWFADAFGPVFAELAGRFHDCVALLERVRAHAAPDAKALAEAYERWLIATEAVPSDDGRVLLVGHPSEA